MQVDSILGVLAKAKLKYLDKLVKKHMRIQMTQSERLKNLALIDEVRTAIFFIQEGLISLNRLDAANDFVHLPLLLLSNGFERLLKIIICLDYLEHTGEFPNSRKFQRWIRNHVVADLLKKVIEIAKKWKYGESRIATEKDMAFLQNDDDLRKMVALLGNYGDKARYYNMNVIVGQANDTDDPEQVFDAYSTDFFMRQKDWQERITGETLGNRIDENIRSVNRQITKLLQTFARALCRMFTLGKLGQPGKAQTGVIGSFLFLGDDDLDKVKPRWFES